MFEKLLFPTDFSRHAESILGLLPSIKSVNKVVLLHVIDPIATYVGVEKKKSETTEKMKDIVRSLSEKGIEAGYRIEVGVPFQEIVRVAGEVRANFIIMGSHGNSFVQDIFLGSVANNVIRLTNLPVLLEKFNYDEITGQKEIDLERKGKYKKILYPTDFSESSLRAFEVVNHLQELGGEEVVIAHIMDSKELAAYLPDRVGDLYLIDQERLEVFKEELMMKGFQAKSVLREGVPYIELNNIAREEDVDLIVIGSHGKSAIAGTLLGSVSEAIARSHVRPVMLVPTRKNL